MKWKNLTPLQRSYRVLRARNDPKYLTTSEHFLNLRPYPKQWKIYNYIYNNLGKINTIVIKAGRRSGKTFLGGWIMATELFNLLSLQDPAEHYNLAKGSEIWGINVARARLQGRRTVYAETVNKLQYSPWFQHETDMDIMAEQVIFPGKHVGCSVIPCSAAGGVGLTCKIAIFDEAARYEETESVQGAWSVYNAISKSTQTFGLAGLRILISSVVHENDIMMEMARKADKIGSMVAFSYPTWEMNPNITRSSLDDEYKLDFASASCEYGNVAHLSSEHFYTRHDAIDNFYDVQKPNLLELIMDNRLNKLRESATGPFYVIAGDPSTKNDSFGVALARFDRERRTVFDGLWFFEPHEESEINPYDVRHLFMSACDHLPVVGAIFDTPEYQELQWDLRNRGLYVVNRLVKFEDHKALKGLTYTYPKNAPYLELASDEQKQVRRVSGTKIDHPKNGSKDVIDAMTNANWMLQSPKSKIHKLEFIPPFHFTTVVLGGNKSPEGFEITEDIFRGVTNNQSRF